MGDEILFPLLGQLCKICKIHFLKNFFANNSIKTKDWQVDGVPGLSAESVPGLREEVRPRRREVVWGRGINLYELRTIFIHIYA